MKELVVFLMSYDFPAWVYFALAGFFAFFSGVAFRHLIKNLYD